MDTTLKDLKASQKHLIEEMLVKVKAKIDASQDNRDA
jgi:hypothetical protein